MFTGLIEEIGHIASTHRHGKVTDITISAEKVLGDVKVGDSLAVNGVCLTIAGIGATSITVQAVEETLKRTSIERLKRGSSVNLERALKLGDRLGGHLVQGHIDGKGKILSRAGEKDTILLSIAPEPTLEPYIVEKGSIAVDGVSLTVTYAKKGEFGVSLIPHTLGETTLENLQVGNYVNIETDIIAKYVQKLIERNESLTLTELQKMGF